MAVVEIDMVYDADGGPLGELRYVLGVIAGRHCGLCDVTHGRLRRRRSFDDLVCSLDVPVHVRHRNEQSPAVAEFTAGRTPTVVGRLDDGTLVELLDAAALDACHGDVERFAVALDAALEGHAARPLGGGPAAGVER
jgi:hypothetical protein